MNCFKSCLLLLFLWIATTTALTKKQIILKDREDRIGSLKHQLKVLERQMEDHVSGKKVIAHARLSSLKKRIAHYNDQLEDLSRALSEEEIEALIAKSDSNSEL